MTDVYIVTFTCLCSAHKVSAESSGTWHDRGVAFPGLIEGVSLCTRIQRFRVTKWQLRTTCMYQSLEIQEIQDVTAAAA